MPRRVRETLPETLTYMMALTGYGQPNDIAEAFRAGFDGHMVKPIDANELEQLCQSISTRRAI